MSIINKLTGLYTRKDVEEIVKSRRVEIERLQNELFLVRLMLSKAHLRDPKTGRLMKKGFTYKITK